jgi:hypothetical protein
MKCHLLLFILLSTTIITHGAQEKQRTLDHKSIGNMLKPVCQLQPSKNSLYCAHAKLTTVSDLPRFIHELQLTTLTSIYIQHNHLPIDSLITTLTHAHALKILDFSHNELDALHSMPPHTALEEIYLNDNHIKSFDFKNFFTNLSNLKICLLHNNQLRHPEVRNVRGLSQHPNCMVRS